MIECSYGYTENIIDKIINGATNMDYIEENPIEPLTFQSKCKGFRFSGSTKEVTKHLFVQFYRSFSYNRSSMS
jgi:hypothetical protein